MSIYLYSIRAKSFAVLTDKGTIRAHTLEMLHTNWRGMHDDDHCPGTHKMQQRAALLYWEKKGLPEYVVMKADEDLYNLYRWTSKTPFWVDTDRIPGEFLGEVGGSKILKPHRCEDHSRELCEDHSREPYGNKIVCGNGSCRKTLEARPGEIDEIRARDAEDRRRSKERHDREQVARSPYLEAKRKLDDLANAWHRGGYDIEKAQAEVKRFSEDLKRAQDRLSALSGERDAAASAWHAFKPEVELLEKAKDEALERIKKEYEAPAVPATDC